MDCAGWMYKLADELQFCLQNIQKTCSAIFLKRHHTYEIVPFTSSLCIVLHFVNARDLPKMSSAMEISPVKATPEGSPPQNGEASSTDKSTPKKSDALSVTSLARYKAAAAQIGIAFQSKSSHLILRSGDIRTDFLTDLRTFLSQRGQEMCVRRIGGKDLDLYKLYDAVLRRGGLDAVMESRGFKHVARQIGIGKSCTSAAYILRREYERWLYEYEQKQVWDKDSSTGIKPMDREERQEEEMEEEVDGGRMTVRPRRQAAMAATSAVAMAMADEPHGYATMGRRGRGDGIGVETENYVREEMGRAGMWATGSGGEKERVIGALWSEDMEEVVWGLGVLNAVSFDARNLMIVSEWGGVLEGLVRVIGRYMDDLKRRRWGEDGNCCGPRVKEKSVVDMKMGGEKENGGLGDATEEEEREGDMGSMGMWNLVDGLRIDREQCATIAVNAVRNLSFWDRNGVVLAHHVGLMKMLSRLVNEKRVGGNIREAVFDCWINVAAFVDVGDDGGHEVLKTCVKLLDPFYEMGNVFGSESVRSQVGRLMNSAEVLARLAACGERNEGGISGWFEELIPRIIDMLHSNHRKCMNAGLVILCNVSAFGWNARNHIGAHAACVQTLIGLLADAEFAPRCALTLSNLAETETNRVRLLAYEEQLVKWAIMPSAAADMLANLLFQITDV